MKEKIYRLKEKFIGLKIRPNDDRFSRHLSQGEIRAMMDSGYGPYFEEIPDVKVKVEKK